MRIALGLAITALAASAIAAETQVEGHYRKDGVYVPPHYRTTPDASRGNNWSSQGNINPHTGAPGTVNPYAPQPPSYPVYPSYPTPPNPYR